MEVSRESIAKAAQDARLELSPEETGLLEGRVNDVFRAAVFLHNDDLDGLEATFYPLKQESIVREDTVAGSLSVDMALANAPEVETTYILVPKIVE